MKLLRNNKGVALVTSLMLTMIALVISAYLLYMVTASTRTSGNLKKYHTALDAAYGGSDIVVKDLIIAGFSFKNYSGTAYTNQMQNTYMSNLQNPSVSSCLRTKLTTPRSQWGGCADLIESPKTAPDISFDLRSANASSAFTVYSKIVDTMERRFIVVDPVTKSTQSLKIAGNTDESGTSLEFGSTTEGGVVTVPHYPYIYRIEVQGERKENPAEKSKVSVVYAY